MTEQETYTALGKKAKAEGKQSRDNPYNFRSLKGHWWDDGFNGIKPKKKPKKRAKRKVVPQKVAGPVPADLSWLNKTVGELIKECN